MSTPRSLASRRAFGEMRGPPSGGAAVGAELAVGFGAAVDGCSLTLRAAGAAVASSAGGFSPGATIHAMVAPTGTTSPSRDFTPARTPSAVASTSTTALSVSTSRRSSPFRIASPSFFNQETIFPVSCAISSAGITTLVAILVSAARENLFLFSREVAAPAASTAHLQRGFKHHLFRRDGRVFQRRREGNRNVHGSDALHRRFEVEEGAFRDDRSDFRSYAVTSVSFV